MESLLTADGEHCRMSYISQVGYDKESYLSKYHFINSVQTPYREALGNYL